MNDQMRSFEDKLALAEKKDTDAMCWIAYRYMLGQDGLPKDVRRAMDWYEKAAQAGHADAQNYVGHCYENGLSGYTRDLQQAAVWYGKAAEQGNKDAEESGTDLAAGEFEKAENGDPEAQWFIGWIYLSSNNVTEGVQYYTLSANNGYVRAQYEIGNFYQYGTYGLLKDPVKAVEFYQKAAAQGHPEAQNNLGQMLYNGYYAGGKMIADAKEAVRWFTEAAKQGCALAMFNLGTCFYNGHGTIRLMDAARKWWTDAAERGHAPAADALRKLNQIQYGRK